MVECDFSTIRPVALIPVPSVRILRAIATMSLEVRNLAIGVAVRDVLPFVTATTVVCLGLAIVFQTLSTVFNGEILTEWAIHRWSL